MRFILNNLKKRIALALLFLFITMHCLNYAEAKKDWVPQWIKKDAKWWGEDEISDMDFVNMIQWVVDKRIINVEYTPIEVQGNQTVPLSIKNVAYFWANGKVSDGDFIESIKYLIKIGIVRLDESFHSQYLEELQQVSVFNDENRSVVIVPVFTASAYGENGFYDYYKGKCDERCLTTTIKDHIPLGFTASQKAVEVLTSLGYETITDIDVDKNPAILAKYDKVIVLHNEYVTQAEFDAITGHSHVLYLYSNSLYAKISVNYNNNTITLVRGHGYPTSDISNGFDWEFGNSTDEYDTHCANMNFYKVKNGIMSNCYPENYLEYNISLLKSIKEF